MDSNIVITETPALQSPSGDMGTTSISDTVTSTKQAIQGLDWNSIIRYGLIVLILAFLGFNLFSYLGKVTGSVTGILGPTVGNLGRAAGTVVKQTTDMTAEGTKDIVDIAAGTVDSGVNLLEKGLDGNTTRNKIDDTSASTNMALDHAVQQTKAPEPDEAGSRTQSSKTVPKQGYCYIGEDRGFRSCIKVDQADMCMSGDVFPTSAICINPNLRE